MSQSKGDRIECEACKVAAGRYRVERIVNVSTPMKANNDLFGFADIVATRKDEPMKLIQVKASQFRDRDYYRMKAKILSSEYVDLEVWIRYDRDGWKFMEWDDEKDGFEEYFRTPACDSSTVRKALQSELKAQV